MIMNNKYNVVAVILDVTQVFYFLPFLKYPENFNYALPQKIIIGDIASN